MSVCNYILNGVAINSGGFDKKVIPPSFQGLDQRSNKKPDSASSDQDHNYYFVNFHLIADPKPDNQAILGLRLKLKELALLL